MWNLEKPDLSLGPPHLCNTVTLSNGVPIESVSKMLGHTKITTTQVHAKVIERKLSDDMKSLKEKLSGKESRENRSTKS